ncbi:MAG: sulfatase-like hydrolase/transferase [Actinomycetota bacterium]
MELPHAPWRYLPSGQEYPQRSPIPGRDGKTWGTDEWLLAQAYQRHLLQTATVDGKLNALIDRLQKAGVYDRALVIVTADHGISFTPGTNMRVAARETLGEIAAVPMFVKLPGQSEGEINDRPVATFDVVPTIADVLDVEGLYPTDGVSMFAPGPARTTREIRSMRGHGLTFGVSGEEKDAVVARKLALFGKRGGVERLYRLAPDRYESLIGLEISGKGGGSASSRASIDSAGSYAHFDPAARLVRCLVTGHLEGVSTTQQILAVVVQGRVVAVTRTFVKSGEVRFHAMISPDAFRRGANTLAIYLVQPGAHAPVLRLIPQSG